MDKTRSRAVASRGKKGKSKGGCYSNPPPSERNPKKVKSKVKKKKQNTMEVNKEEEKKDDEKLPAQDLSGTDSCLDSDDPWDGPTYVGPNGKRYAVAFGLIGDSDED